MTMLSALLLLAVAYVMLCRIAKMPPGRTLWYIPVQHGVLAFCAFAAACMLAIRPEAAAPVFAAGVLAFFLLSTHRWRDAPEATASKPAEFDPAPHHHYGGSA